MTQAADRDTALNALTRCEAKTATTRRGELEWVLMRDICGGIVCLLYNRTISRVPITTAPRESWQVH